MAEKNAPSQGSSSPEVSKLALVAASVTVVLWASAFIAIRGAGSHFDPGSMALLRMLVGSAGLGIYALWRGIEWPQQRDWTLVIVWGVAWFCCYNLALNTAERLIDAGTASMVVNLAPLIVIAVGGLALREGYPRGLLVGATVSFCGVVLIGLQSTNHLGLKGLGLALLSAFLYAGCTLLQKRLLRTVEGATLTWLGTLVGVISLLPWTGRLINDLNHAPATATLQVVYLGLFPTAIAFTTWSYVLSRMSAGQTSATTYATPAVALLLSWVLLDETPTILKLIGGGLCLAGVGITRSISESSRSQRNGAPGPGAPQEASPCAIRLTHR